MAALERWPRIAVTAVFVVHGLLFASWTAHIPDVARELGMRAITFTSASDLDRELRCRER